MGVVDMDHSDLSRRLVRHYDASPTLRIAGFYASVAEGSRAMRSGEIKALLVIPNHLKRGVLNGKPLQVTAFYNTQLLLIGKLIKSALIESHASFGIEIEAFIAMAEGETGLHALSSAIPVGSQLTPLFNINSNYAKFLVSAILPALWQILMVTATIMVLARELREQGVRPWLGRTPVSAILVKLLPYSLLLWMQGLFFLWFLFVFLGWPMNGSWAVLIVAQGLTVLASQAMGLMLFMMTQNAARAFSFAAAYSAPSFAFLGVTFPASDMTQIAQLWRSLLPMSHYMDIQLFQANHGASLKSALPDLFQLSAFLLLFPLIFLLLIRFQHKHPTNQEVGTT